MKRIPTFLLACIGMLASLCPSLLSGETIPVKNGSSVAPITIPYAISGNGTTTVLFIHGFMDAGNVWESVIQKMNPQKYHFVTLDLPFMGALSDCRGEVSLSAMAEAVAGVVDELEQPVFLVGQSMGAQIAELVARSCPDAIAGMVFIAPVPLSGLPVPEQFVAEMQSMAGNEAMQLESRRSAFPRLAEVELQKHARNGAGIALHNVPALIAAWSRGHPAGSMPGPHATPVLIIGGAADEVCTPAVIESQVAPRFAMGKTEFLPRAGHWLHIDHPDEVAAEIERFLTGAGRE